MEILLFLRKLQGYKHESFALQGLRGEGVEGSSVVKGLAQDTRALGFEVKIVSIMDDSDIFTIKGVCKKVVFLDGTDAIMAKNQIDTTWTILRRNHFVKKKKRKEGKILLVVRVNKGLDEHKVVQINHINHIIICISTQFDSKNSPY